MGWWTVINQLVEPWTQVLLFKLWNLSSIDRERRSYYLILNANLGNLNDGPYNKFWKQIWLVVTIVNLITEPWQQVGETLNAGPRIA